MGRIRIEQGGINIMLIIPSISFGEADRAKLLADAVACLAPLVWA